MWRQGDDDMMCNQPASKLKNIYLVKSLHQTAAAAAVCC
jgi:hypothetical protein